MTDLERARRAIAGARHVAVMTGAGVSAESGIPTFRGAGGLWRGHDPMSLATPCAFAEDPELVWDFYNWRRQVVQDAEPNPAHHALAELSRLVPESTLITQNVDRLHQRAGSRGVIELHGNQMDVRCTSCGRTTDRTGVVLPRLPTCGHCQAPARPAVVWFGEPLPAGAWERALSAVQRADVVGSPGTELEFAL